MKYLLAAAILFLMQNPSVTDSTSKFNTQLTTAFESFNSEAVEIYSDNTIHYNVTINTISHEVFADDGTLVATYHYEYPQMQPVRGNGAIIHTPNNKSEEHALLVSQNFNNYFNDFQEEHSDYSKYAKDSTAEELYLCKKNEGDGVFFPFYEEIKYADIYQTDNIISLYGHFQSYTGGARPWKSSLGLNFDLKSGKFFSSEILGKSNFNKAVAAEIIRQANRYSEAPVNWQDFVKDSAVKNWSDCVITFNNYGMVVTFPRLFTGEPTFLLPYEFLEPHLSNRGKILLGLYDN
ncbi:MAG: DUF4163 domain-containing protein [Oscillospiraceae bacterium]|nr:DUF4163 domain-containing protein [Oscillospiraceae bacterium]